MITLNKISLEFEKYLVKLESFFSSYNLEGLIKDPIDHIAVKMRDKSDYDAFINSIISESESLYEIEMHNRRIATAKMKNSFLKNHAVRILEIMEPKPEKVGKGLVGFEHIEIFKRNLDSITPTLKKAGIIFEEYDNGFHKAIVVEIGDLQEIKFTDSYIEEVVKKEKSIGKIIQVK